VRGTEVGFTPEIGTALFGQVSVTSRVCGEVQIDVCRLTW
jgi:hypothetical protein